MPHTLLVGGTRGLGRSIMRLLNFKGHQVSIIGRRDPPSEDLRVNNVHYWTADLRDGNKAQLAAEAAVAKFGPLNYLIFCQRYRDNDDDWEGEIQVSMTATKNLIEGLILKFSPEGDKGIVIISSVFGDYIGDGQPLSYHVGKAGLNQISRFYAVNLGCKKIRVNTVTPFTYLKEESKSFYLKNKELLELYEEIIPLGRMGSSEDSANAVAFLCSPEASFISGQNIYVDGGLSQVWPETVARKLKSI